MLNLTSSYSTNITTLIFSHLMRHWSEIIDSVHRMPGSDIPISLLNRQYERLTLTGRCKI